MAKTIEKDFTVVGAGLAGMCAAISAARKGLKVALLNDRSVLGGNASSEIGVTVLGASHHGLSPSIYAKEGGLIEEIRQKLLYAQTSRGFDRNGAKDAVYLELIMNEPNIELFLNTAAMDVEVKDNTIRCVRAYNIKSETEYEFVSPQYADCSGDGIVGFKAGASFMMGSEAKFEYGERWAPQSHESYTMGNSIYWEIEDTGKPVKFVAPAFAKDITQMPTFSELENPLKFRNLSVNGVFWTLEYGGLKNTIKDSEEIAFELRCLAYGIWDYIKNSGKFPEAENFVMKKMWSIPGTREGRRFFGDYVLSENDIEEKRDFEDAVAIGGWPMDVHDWGGFYGRKPASNFIPVTGIYNVPFRSLYSKDISNLMFAGRNISATHIAFGSTRVMATCACLGQAVGLAAVICRKYYVNPREIYKSHIKELQQELVYGDQTISGVSDILENCINHEFTITSSGTAKFENTKQDLIKECDHNYVLALTVDTKMVESIKIKLKNNTNTEQIINYEVLTGDRPETFLPEYVLKKSSVKIEPDFYGFVLFELNVEIGNDQKVYVVIPKNENISICCANKRIPGAVSWRYYDHTHTTGEYWDKKSKGYNHDTTPFKGVRVDFPDSGEIEFSFYKDKAYHNTGYLGCDQVKHQICFKDVVPRQGIYNAENLMNEYSRPYGVLNKWVSDSVGAFLVLNANKPQYVKEVHLIFDTDLENEKHTQLQEVLVKDYDVIFNTLNSQKIVKIRDNYLRYNKIDVNIEEVYEIRIDILQTHGGDKVHMYGIKVLN